MTSDRLKEKLRSSLTIKPGEGKLVGLMFLYNFTLLVTLYLLKPVRDSLFLVELGPQQLPFVFIITALVVIPVSAGYSRFSNQLTLGWVINGVTFFLTVNLIVIWWLLRSDSSILYYLLYIWVSIYSILITSQFWLLANALFNAVQAKRIFSLLSLAAIAGAIAGGEITGFLIDEFRITSESLILIGAGILFMTVFLVQEIRGEANHLTTKNQTVSSGAETESLSYNRTLFQEIGQSRHLMLIMGIIALSVITTTIIDYQFKTLASQVYTAENELSIFMGRFYGRVSIIAFLLQLFVSSKFIDWRGVGGAVAILPTILLLGTAGLFIWTGLAAAVLLRGADQSLKHSLDRTGRELLFLPVEIDMKKRTKVFIDLFVDNGAQGVAGVLLLLLIFVATLTVKQMSLVVAGLLLCWIILIVWVRRTYINEFRISIKEQVGDEEYKESKKLTRLSFSDVVSSLSDQDDQVLYQLLIKLEHHYKEYTLPGNKIEEFLTHPNPSIRRQCLQVFRTRELEGYMDKIAELLQDPDAEVRLEAARYIYHFYDPEKHGDDGLEILSDGLNHDDAKIRAAAFGLIVKDGEEPEKGLLFTELLEETLRYEGEGEEELKIETARVLGVAYHPSRMFILRELLFDSSESVVKAAIESAGQSGDRIFIHILLRYLSDNKFKKAAQKSLAKYGERIFGTMFDYMADDKVELSTRLQIPFILYLNAGPVAAEVLQLALDQSPLPVRHEIIKALTKINRKIASPRFNNEKLARAVQEEIRRYALLQQCGDVLYSTDNSTELMEILNEEIEKGFENIFRLLGLLHGSADIYNAYRGITSNDEKLIAEGIEFVENLIDWEERKILSPLLKSRLTGRRNYGEFEGEFNGVKDVLDYLRNLNHPVLKKELKKNTTAQKFNG